MTYDESTALSADGMRMQVCSSQGALALRGTASAFDAAASAATATVYITSSSVAGKDAGHASSEPKYPPTVRFAEGVLDSSKGAAWGSFEATEAINGWNTLWVEGAGAGVGASDVSVVDAAYAGGYLEGRLTHTQVWEFWRSMGRQFFGKGIKVDARYSGFVARNLAWVRQRAAAAPVGDAYWQRVRVVLAQLDGLAAGYASAAPASRALDLTHIAMMNADGDMETLQALYPPTRGANHTRKPTRCSSMIRLVPGNADLFMGHDTWDSMSSMLRIYKHYSFVTTVGGKRTPVSMSSSPGFLSSVDDWYQTPTLVVTETTNGIPDNATLLQQVTPTAGLPSWLRCMVATYGATTGAEWAATFAKYNGGTYNNQWIVVTLAAFTRGEPPAAGLLTVAEQVPGYVHVSDETQHLVSAGYWASYNIPYFRDIYDMSGFAALEAKYGASYSHEHCPRANMFRKLAPAVHTLEDYQRVMRYNDWKNDPAALGNPCNGIMARCDLLPAGSSVAFGGIDSKTTAFASAQQRTCWAMNGPTWETQPQFRWSTSGLNDTVNHEGQPDLFNFDYVKMAPPSR